MAVIDNLVAYYSLDESSGDAIDAHGANDLTDINTVGTTTGKVSSARAFVQASAEYFTRADNTDLSLGSDTAFSWAGWVYATGDFSGRAIFGKGADTSTGTAYLLWGNSSDFQMSFVVGNGSSSATVGDNYDVASAPYNDWHFVVVSHDPGANQISLQVDNGTKRTTSWSGGTQDESNTFYFGRDASTASWDGRLDEFGFWKKVLQPDEVTWLYNSGAGRSYADIVAEAGGGDVFTVVGRSVLDYD